MSPPAPPDTALADLRAENEALRRHNQHLLARLAAPPTLPADQDCSEQRQVRFRTVFEQSPLGQKIIHPDLTIRQANATLVTMLGCTDPAQVEGRPILDFAHPHFRADWHHLQQQLWTHKLPCFTLETCLVRTDGSSFWCQVYSILFSDEGQEFGYTTLIDITAQKQLQDALQRLNETQETILHLVAHDVRNPLAHIQLATQLLRKSQGTGPDSLRYLAIIDQACGQEQAILKDVLYIGQLDQARLEQQPTDLQPYLTAHLARHQLTAQAKGITLAVDFSAHTLQADLQPEKFGRVLDNLLANAFKFTPAGGCVTVHLSEQAGRPRLAVQDTGIGIPLEHQAHLFDKFSSAAREGLAGESTTGLGLFITQQIVHLHGGHIWVESREQEGTTFFIDL
jgi:two-component system sensor histidine kinase VicK